MIVDDRVTWLGGAAFADESDPGQSLAHQYDNFFAAVRGEEPLRVGIAENRAVVEVITGLYRSAREGRPVGLGRI